MLIKHYQAAVSCFSFHLPPSPPLLTNSIYQKVIARRELRVKLQGGVTSQYGATWGEFLVDPGFALVSGFVSVRTRAGVGMRTAF